MGSLVILILGLVFMVLFFILMNKKINLDYSNKVELSNLEKQKFYLSIDRDKLIAEIDNFVNSVIDEYCLLYVNNSEEPYITEKMQEEMNKQVMIRIVDKLSIPMISKIRLCIHVKDDRDIYNYIKYTVSLGIMKKVLETNRMIDEDKVVDMDKEASDILGSIIDEYNIKSNF